MSDAGEQRDEQAGVQSTQSTQSTESTEGLHESSGDSGAARDAAHWAKTVSRLNVSEVPAGAVNRNVSGRRLAGPIQGFGKMWQKTYQVRLPRHRVAPTELIATWKQRFPDFWPEGNRFYAPLTGIEPGEVALLNLSLPGRMNCPPV